MFVWDVVEKGVHGKLPKHHLSMFLYGLIPVIILATLFGFFK